MLHNLIYNVIHQVHNYLLQFWTPTENALALKSAFMERSNILRNYSASPFSVQQALNSTVNIIHHDPQVVLVKSNTLIATIFLNNASNKTYTMLKLCFSSNLVPDRPSTLKFDDHLAEETNLAICISSVRNTFRIYNIWWTESITV